MDLKSENCRTALPSVVVPSVAVPETLWAGSALWSNWPVSARGAGVAVAAA